MTKLIGLAGAKRSGKNTVGDIIVADYHVSEDPPVQGNVRLVSFAEKLKVAAARALGLNSSSPEVLVSLMDAAKEDWTFTVTTGGAPLIFSGREYLQWFGTEAGRETFAPNFWVDLVLPNPIVQEGWGGSVGPEMLDRAYAGYDLVVVTDTRFPNEAQRVLDLGGEVWEVQRPGLESGDGHASEVPLPREYVTRTIINDGSLTKLESLVKANLVTV